jgi:hypothetical protein
MCSAIVHAIATVLQVCCKFMFKQLFAGNCCNVGDFKFRGLTSRGYTTEYMFVPLVDQFIEQALSWTNLQRSESVNAQLLEDIY